MQYGTARAPWLELLDFWFPEGRRLDIDAATHRDCWRWRMRGGADEAIIHRFTPLTVRAAAGELDHWADEAEGRLALIIVLDQFSRSVWRNSRQAYAQDAAALSLSLEGLNNGHYAALETPWFRVVHGLPLGHCEGPDHLERMQRLIALRQEIAAQAPPSLQPIYHSLVQQARDVQQIIARFGRHPHRNQLLGRMSSAAEQQYIKSGQFPHLRVFQEESPTGK